MTLTELAKKHDIPHDKAVAFLREWLSMQPTVSWHVADYEAYKDQLSRIDALIAEMEAKG